jgi:hypothetical protein
MTEDASALVRRVDLRARLHPKDDQLLCYRHGLGGGPSHDVRDAAEFFEVSEVEVRRLEREAIERLEFLAAEADGVPWREPVSTARYEAGVLVSFSGPIDLWQYDVVPDPDDPRVETRLFAPSPPTGFALETLSGRWRHVHVGSDRPLPDGFAIAGPRRVIHEDHVR